MTLLIDSYLNCVPPAQHAKFISEFLRSARDSMIDQIQLIRSNNIFAQQAKEELLEARIVASQALKRGLLDNDLIATGVAHRLINLDLDREVAINRFHEQQNKRT